MRFGLSIILTALVVYAVCAFGFTMGLSVGADAPSLDETTVAFDGQNFTAGGETQPVNYTEAGERTPDGPVESWLYEHTPIDRPVSANTGPVASGVRDVANALIWGSFHLAALTGSVGAFVGYYLPQPLYGVTSAALNGLNYLVMFGGVGLYFQQTWRRFA